MGHDLLNAFAAIATLTNVTVMAAGIWGGVIIGAIPGMTGTMAVTLALPFTFHLSPVPSLLLLVALYKGSTYGGSISAILIKTPGTASAACTVLDGYPLARQGKGGKALTMALVASCVGDFMSNVALIFLAAPLAIVALRVGPPDYFMLMAFSLTIVASISGRSLLLGIVSACLGFLCATVGEDIYGSFRFAMIEDMKSGLNIVAVLIGLFALPEMIKIAVFRPEDTTTPMNPGDNRLTLAEVRNSLKSIVRGSLIGVVLGAIPGIGPSTAAFFSYDMARRTSKNGARFGTGDLEGVAASEAANNGCCGATMIPLLALGVPGDVITGVMLGAFMIHGLTPGPLLFQNNPVEVYTLFIGMMFSSALLFMAGTLTIGGFSKIAAIPRSLLTPCVVVLCVYGSYSVAANPFDVAVLLVMGGVGFVMMILDIPLAPFLVAFILGPLFEDNLRRSLAMSQGDLGIFFQSWISWAFFLPTLLFVILTVLREGRHRRPR